MIRFNTFDFSNNSNKRSFVLVSVLSAANHRLHLGHIGGPLLKLDVAARLLQMYGHQTKLVIAADVYQADISILSAQEGLTEETFVNRNSQAIQHDLNTFDIGYDNWISPLNLSIKSHYEQQHQELLQRLTEKGYAHYQTRTVPFSHHLPVSQHLPFSQTSGGFVPDSLISGECPSCGYQASGGFCEICGRQLSSSELINACLSQAAITIPAGCSYQIESIPQIGNTPTCEEMLSWQSHSLLEFSLPAEGDKQSDLQYCIQQTEASSFYRDIANEHVQKSAASSLLTTPGYWGVPYTSPDGEQYVVHPDCTLYPYSLALGKCLSQMDQTLDNPFHKDSETLSIVSFSVDRSVSSLAYPCGFALTDTDHNNRPRYKTYDYFWGNEQLQLEAEKFSTQQNHVIWARELIEHTPIQTDWTRYYLATIDPADTESAFTLQGLVDCINNVVINRILKTAYSQLADCLAIQPAAVSHKLEKKINRALSQQQECLRKENLDMRGLAALIENFLIDNRTGESNKGLSKDRKKDRNKSRELDNTDSYWTLKTLALLTYPVLPQLGCELWLHLGHSGSPNLDHFWLLTEPKVKPRNLPEMDYTGFDLPEPISLSDVEQCLPNHLLNKVRFSPRVFQSDLQLRL